MKKKILAIIISAVMTAACLTGCGSKTEGETKKIENNSDSMNSGTQDGTSDDLIANLIASTEGEVSLTVWVSEEDQNLTNGLIESFEAEYPDVKFNITLIPESEASAKDNLLVDVEAGPDIFTFADDQINELVKAEALKEVNIAYSYDIKDSNVAGAIDAATVDNKLYAYPMTADNGYVMFYDASVFTEEDVKSMDTMIAKAKAVNKKIAMDISNGWYIYSFFQGAGYELSLNEDGFTNTCNWNENGGTDVAQAIVNMLDTGVLVDLSDEDQVSQITDGKICAAVNGTWRAETAQQAWGKNYAATKLPTFTVSGEQKQMSSFSGYKLIGVNPYSEYVEWSMILAEYLTNYDSQVIRYEKRGFGPSNIEAANSDIVLADPAISALAAQAEFATPQRVGSNYWVAAEELGKNLVKGAEGDNLQSLLDKAVEGITAPTE